MPSSLSTAALGETIGLCVLALLAIAMLVKGIRLLNAPAQAPPPPQQSTSFGTTSSEPAGQPAFFGKTITPASNLSAAGGTATATVPGHRAVSAATRKSAGNGRMPYVLIVLGAAILTGAAYFAFGMWSDAHPDPQLHGIPEQAELPNNLLGMKRVAQDTLFGRIIRQVRSEDIQGGFGTTVYAGYGDRHQALMLMVAKSDHVIGTADDYFTDFERSNEAENQLDIHLHPVPAGKSGGEIRCAVNSDPAIALCAWVDDGYIHGDGIAGSVMFNGPLVKDFKATMLKVRKELES